MTDDEIAADSVSFNVKVTDENTGRTMIVWPDAATKHLAINDLRALVMEMMNTKLWLRQQAKLCWILAKIHSL